MGVGGFSGVVFGWCLGRHALLFFELVMETCGMENKQVGRLCGFL